MFFFFQAEDGIRDAQESRGLGDVYKRQTHVLQILKIQPNHYGVNGNITKLKMDMMPFNMTLNLSLTGLS